jgi:CheY-like chemotaxis protein
MKILYLQSLDQGDKSSSRSQLVVGILIVDDDLDTGEAMSELLAYQGFEVELASDGQSALEALRSADTLPDVILLDLMMPVMNGWQFRRAQLDDPQLASVPVIVVTASLASDSQLSQLKAAALFHKPVDAGTLVRKINSICH